MVVKHPKDGGGRIKFAEHLLSVLVVVALLCCSLNGFAAHGDKKVEKKTILKGTADYPEILDVW